MSEIKEPSGKALKFKLSARFSMEEGICYIEHGTETKGLFSRYAISAKWKQLKEPIGTGTFGEVYRQELVKGNETYGVRAVKRLRKDYREVNTIVEILGDAVGFFFPGAFDS